jgi:hypothetical protein
VKKSSSTSYPKLRFLDQAPQMWARELQIFLTQMLRRRKKKLA